MDDGFFTSLKLLAVIVGYFVGLAVGSLISAIWLRLAAMWLGFQRIPYLRAYGCVLVTNFAVSTLSFSTGVNHRVFLALADRYLENPDTGFRPPSMYLSFTPTLLFYVTVLGLLLTAALFARFVKDTDSARIRFGDAFGLAALYYAISFAVAIVLALIAFCIVQAILLVVG